jgi:hypothetical protein
VAKGGAAGVRTQLVDKNEVRTALGKIIERGAVFEVRALNAQLRGKRRSGTVFGYFDNADACLSELEKVTTAKGIYFTANPADPALLARRANRLDYAEKNDATTNDQHILRRHWFLLDSDADRPSGISATNAEKAAAKEKACEIYRFLKARGWTEPVVADSGNGFHLLYRVDLPAGDDGLLEELLAALATRFDGDGVTIDRSVHNPARIVRLYGTLAAKGDDTKERPHRLSKIVKAPEALQVVSVEQLLALVNELQSKETKTANPPARCTVAFDVEAFLARHGVEVADKIVEPNGTVKWRLKLCPFNPDHESPDAAVFQYPDRKLGFHCFHNSCTGKQWKDFREHFEPGYKNRRRASKNDESDEEKSPRKSAATEAVEIAEGFKLFHDPQDRPFVRVELKEHVEVWGVESPKFRKLLARTYYQQRKRAINRNALADAITTLAGRACHDSPEEPVFLRVASYGKDILIDLCDERWRVVEITPDDWQILDKSPVAFIRTGSMQALPEPLREGGSIEPLWELLNVTKEQRPLVAGALLNFFHPDGPYFVLNFVGEQGSAKTCAARMVRQLVDPNANPLRSPPKEERDLIAQAANNRAVALDNLSSLPPLLSDAICRLSTGGGHSARTLYTDLEEISLAIKRPVILNGIEDVATRPDLAERALQIELEGFEEKKGKQRIPEKKLWQKFDEHKAAIFSAILDALACALRELPNVKLDSLPRMADAALWATAGETAFGFKPGAFMAAYRRNLDEGAVASIEAHPVGLATRKLLEKQDEWEGEPAELLEALSALVPEQQRREKNWPTNPRSLSARLRRLAPALRRAGISYETSKGQRRTIRMCKARKFASRPSLASQTEAEDTVERDAKDSKDAKIPNLHVWAEEEELRL